MLFLQNRERKCTLFPLTLVRVLQTLLLCLVRASDSMAHLAGKISGMSDLGLRTANCRRFWETQVGTRSLDSLRPSELITTAESWETFEFYGFWEAFRGFWVTRGIYA